MEKNIEQFIYEEIIQGEGEVTFDYLGKKSIMKAMESYAQYKVNELNKSDVIKSVCECTQDTFCCRCYEQKGWVIKDGKFVKQTVL